MASVALGLLGSEKESRDYVPLLKWLLLWVLIAFGTLVLWYFGLIGAMLESDHTRISLIIIAIFLAGSLHCLYQTIIVSRELISARKVRDAIEAARGRALMVKDEDIITSEGTTLERGIVTEHISNLMAKARNLSAGASLDQTVLLRSLADRLRSREKLGLFVSESLLRIALLGTAIGFILMLIPISGLGAFDVDSLRNTLAGMTGGMAVALNVTVTGIGTALLLKFQYYLLDEAIADLFREITEVTEVHVIPALEPVVNAGRI